MCCINDAGRLAKVRARKKVFRAWKVVRKNGSSIMGKTPKWKDGLNVARSGMKDLTAKSTYDYLWPSGFHFYFKRDAAKNRASLINGVRYRRGILERVVVPVWVNPRAVIAAEDLGFFSEGVAWRVRISLKEWRKAGVVL